MADTVDQLSRELRATMMDGATSDAIDRAEYNASRLYVDPRTLPLRFSLLREASRSLAHYEYACQQPQDHSLAAKLGGLSYAPDKKDALRFGIAAHLLLLLGDAGAKQIAVFTGKVRNGKAWDAFQVEADDTGKRVILNQRELAHVTAIVAAIRRHQRAMDLLFDGAGAVVEQTISWDYLGRRFRSTPDTRHQQLWYLADLKTTVSSEPRQFMRHALRFGYNAQAALYGLAIEAAEGWTPESYYLVAVEKPRPHPTTIFRLTDEAILAGQKLVRLWTEAVLAGEAAGVYPGYVESDVDFDVPRLDDDFALSIGGELVEVG